ncbi:outer membrane beta-barrel protein [Taibaiella chishuiensis]|uniref:Outer membrane protein with beta-barrel domain n=1 Tax=Taibaiella chishuiensis TaxID=1434707 RepID=A0A2P8CY39_9BACT|nr:outer membrane beta-barrel protein [Taibaiella chishuiensis]PSK89836.1 outer membrane protein with beta-barrel domain [Taibaiella chishuiensis]
MRALLTAMVFLCCALPAPSVRAQVQYAVYAGGGYPYASATKSAVSNNFIVTPNAAVLLHIPVGKHIGIETGLSYTVKGLINDDTLFNDHAGWGLRFRLRKKLDYLGIPLMLTWRVKAGKQHDLFIGGGMVYSFMLRGVTKGYNWIFSPNGLSESGWDEPIQPVLIPDRDLKISQEYFFDAGLKLQLSYVWRGRYGIRLFHEQSLYSYHTPGSGVETRLRYTGIALSFGFPRLP